jgi:hypothetical protein
MAVCPSVFLGCIVPRMNKCGLSQMVTLCKALEEGVLSPKRGHTDGSSSIRAPLMDAITSCARAALPQHLHALLDAPLPPGASPYKAGRPELAPAFKQVPALGALWVG